MFRGPGSVYGIMQLTYNNRGIFGERMPSNPATAGLRKGQRAFAAVQKMNDLRHCRLDLSPPQRIPALPPKGIAESKEARL